ncbi:VOC family protein [Alkalicoccobacillus porphyridii]|uniref:Metallothiol transferase fosB n=1 Tax=Alkalicoccobacillus porphyridii TaxID=2597270 RepID=A0A553ZU97_9BACI|nr:VOC family protein [Alkalicoccobacillus porphyridii]TSB44895.1 metallothiol transferase fosB [Alkalicoccobacillus porphyridii]
MIQGLGHITFSVTNMARSVRFYQAILGASPTVHGEKTAYFEVAGLWIALNLEDGIPRKDIYDSYTHVAFSVRSQDLTRLRLLLESIDADILPGRNRSVEGEGDSIYFRDPDGHLLEFHTGNITQRKEHYKKTNPSLLTNFND